MGGTVTRDHVLTLFAQTTPTGIDRVFATANEALAIDEEDDLRVDADVAVIDTGTDDHEDLDVVQRTDCATQKQGTFECVDDVGEDYDGHGTHVAGTIGAIDNDKGVVGVAPGARIWSVRVYLFTPPIELFESSAVAGVDWVTAARQDEDPENDIEVANMSFGCHETVEPKCPSGLPALDSAITSAVEEGVVMVAAAGNSAINAEGTHPASHPDVIAVSALEDFDGMPGEGKDPLASFSNFGSAVDAAAPGVSILSTVPGDGYGFKSGTSMASPHVAGAAAILAAHDKPESKADVEAIRETIVEAGNFGWEDTSGDGIKEPLLDVGDEAVFDPTPLPAWGIAPTPNVAGGPNQLTDVSCTSSSFCFASAYFTLGTTWAYGLAWNGSNWANWGGPPENGALQLNAASCTSTTSCTAVGNQTVSGGRVLTRALHWDGEGWSYENTENAPGAEENRLAGVSCVSTDCKAVGSYTDGGDTSNLALHSP